MTSKLVFILLLYCYALLSCNNFSKSSGQNNIESHVKYADSFIQAEQYKVLGDLRFGMSKEEAADILHKLDPRDRSGPAKLLGQFEYDILDPEYDSNKLYRLRLAKYLGGFNDFDNIAELVKSKFGEPDTDESMTNTVDSCRSERTAKWIIGKKAIEIREIISECKVSYVAIVIFLPEVEDRIWKSREEIERIKNDSLKSAGKEML